MRSRPRDAGVLVAIVLSLLLVPFAHGSFVAEPASSATDRVSTQRGALAEPPFSAAGAKRIRLLPRAEDAEPVVEETRTIEAAPRVIGVGPGQKVLSEGQAGLVVVRVGTVSGAVVATETLIAPVPALVRRVPAPGANLVALTFDDGPWPGQTETVLSILEQRNVPATFFMIGQQVERMPGIARAVVAGGHAVGNHTFSHAYLDSGNPEVEAWEIEYTNQTIQAMTGVRPTWLRAPGGKLGGEAQALIAQAGMRSALWTVDPQDWLEGATTDQIVWSVLSAAHPGAVVLLHDGGGDQSATIAALPAIIDGLRAAGYEFVTLDEMPEVRAAW